MVNSRNSKFAVLYFMTEINIQGVDNINFVGRFTDITLDYEIKNSLP